MFPITEKTITFTTTAMPRPELIDKTYASFSRHLLDFDFKQATLYINVDSFPDKKNDDKRKEVVDIAHKYFGNVIANLPEVPNFASAVKWCFSKVDTYYCFNLEDDWELLTPFKVSVFNQFFIPPHVQQLAFRAWKHVKNNFWLSPSFLRGSFCREIAEKMNTVDNPEVQIRKIREEYKTEGFLYFPFDHRSVILKDLGRNWMKENRYNRGEQNFTQWTPVEEGKGYQKLADQNSQIPPEMISPSSNDKKAIALSRWVKSYEKQRVHKLRHRK